MKQTLLQFCAFATLTVGFISFVGCSGAAEPKSEGQKTEQAQPAADPAAAQPEGAAAHEHAAGDTTHQH